MIASLTSLAGLVGGGGSLPWRWIGLGAAVLAAGAVYLYILSIEDDRARLEAENRALQTDLRLVSDVAEANAAAAREARREASRHLAAVEAEREAFAARLAALQSIRTEIDHAPATDDAPVAPVLGRALDGLRRALGAPAGGDQDRDGETASPTAAAALPAGADPGG